MSDIGTCFTLYTETDDIYKDIAEHVETWFDISNYELDRPLPKGKNKKSSWIDEKWVGWRTHKKICWLRAKTYNYLIGDCSEGKEQKTQKVCCVS